MSVLSELESRNLAHTLSDRSLADAFEQGPVRFYVGFDPSHDSLQIGNLFAIVTMARLQRMGHRPVVLVGGATGMIGDPSGNSAERKLLSEDALAHNQRGIRAQLERYLDFTGSNAAVMVNNYDWLGAMSFIGFLRDVGPRFRVTEMLAKESVKRRLEASDGMSYTEFAYQILQAYDFLHLFRTMDVRLQIGGADQWGNIAAGIDLIRRVEAGLAYGLCIPLVTDASGNKLGKSVGGALYLDAQQTSPYRLYQFFLNAEDAKVGEYLRFYTFLGHDEIAELERTAKADPGARSAQKALAAAVVEFVHGPEGLSAALKATQALFGADLAGLSDADLDAVFGHAPSAAVSREAWGAGMNVVDLLALTDPFKGKNDARRAIDQRGAYVNNQPVLDPAWTLRDGDLLNGHTLVVRRGKKQYAVVKVGSRD